MDKLLEIIEVDRPSINLNGRICHHRVKILYALCKYYNLTRYLEIGVHNGASMSYVLQCSTIKLCVGIDPFEDLKTKDPHMKHYQNMDHITQEKTIKNLNHNNKYDASILLEKNYSYAVKKNQIPGDFDLFFIDGDHSYSAVLDDFYKFFDIVSQGGIIVFDDLHQEGPSRAFEHILNNETRIELIGIYDKTEGIIRKI